MTSANDTALSGATRVLGLWIVLGALIGAVWSTRLHSTVDSWFLVSVFLGASGALSPIYGGFLYFSARRREQTRTARGAGAVTITLFIFGLATAVIVLTMLKALSGLR